MLVNLTEVKVRAANKIKFLGLFVTWLVALLYLRDVNAVYVKSGYEVNGRPTCYYF